MKTENILRTLGLTEKESDVYLSLLESGPALISQICRDTGFHRPTVYQISSSLQSKGLISITTLGKQKRFVAETPEKLRALFEMIKTDFQNFLPGIQDVYDNQDKRPLVKFFKGKKGVTSVIEDLLVSLKRGESYYRYGSKKAQMEVQKYLPKDYVDKRESKQIGRYVITDQLSEHQKRRPSLDRFHKFISNNLGFSDCNIIELIYKNKVVFADLGSVNAVIIENADVANFQKKIFMTLFNLL